MDTIFISKKLNLAKKYLSSLSIHKDLSIPMIDKAIDLILDNLSKNPNKFNKITDNEFNNYYIIGNILFDEKCNFIINTNFNTNFINTENNDLIKRLSEVYIITDDNKIYHIVCSGKVSSSDEVKLSIKMPNIYDSTILDSCSKYIFEPVFKDDFISDKESTIDKLLLQIMIKYISQYAEYKRGLV